MGPHSSNRIVSPNRIDGMESSLLSEGGGNKWTVFVSGGSWGLLEILLSVTSFGSMSCWDESLELILEESGFEEEDDDDDVVVADKGGTFVAVVVNLVVDTKTTKETGDDDDDDKESHACTDLGYHDTNKLSTTNNPVCLRPLLRVMVLRFLVLGVDC